MQADSFYHHPFMPVTLRHCWDKSIAMSAEVMLDTGDAATGIYLPLCQVQKLQLRPLGASNEVEGWGGGTTRLQQYEPIWVSGRHGHRHGRPRPGICTIDLVAPLISQDLARLSPYHCCCHCLRTSTGTLPRLAVIAIFDDFSSDLFAPILLTVTPPMRNNLLVACRKYCPGALPWLLACRQLCPDALLPSDVAPFRWRST